MRHAGVLLDHISLVRCQVSIIYPRVSTFATNGADLIAKRWPTKGFAKDCIFTVVFRSLRIATNSLVCTWLISQAHPWHGA